MMVLCGKQLGIDMLCVDEAHYFKNLAIATRMSNIAGVSTTASQKAFDLYCKANYIKSKGGSIIFGDRYTYEQFYDRVVYIPALFTGRSTE